MNSELTLITTLISKEKLTKKRFLGLQIYSKIVLRYLIANKQLLRAERMLIKEEVSPDSVDFVELYRLAQNKPTQYSTARLQTMISSLIARENSLSERPDIQLVLKSKKQLGPVGSGDLFKKKLIKTE